MPKKKDAPLPLAHLSPIEWGLIILIVFLSTLAVLVNVNPTRRLNEASNARRFSDVTAIIDDLIDYRHEFGVYPDELQNLLLEQAYELGSCDAGAHCDAVPVADDCIDVSALSASFIDPEDGSLSQSGYYLILRESGEVTIGACSPDPEGTTGDGPIPAINLTD